MSKTVFTATEDEKLIEEVGKNRVLYDSSLEKHRDVNFKDAIWNSISSIVGRTSMLFNYLLKIFFKYLFCYILKTLNNI